MAASVLLAVRLQAHRTNKRDEARRRYEADLRKWIHGHRAALAATAYTVIVHEKGRAAGVATTRHMIKAGRKGIADRISAQIAATIVSKQTEKTDAGVLAGAVVVELTKSIESGD